MQTPFRSVLQIIMGSLSLSTTGTSTYNIGERRDVEREYHVAHNTVAYNGQNSSEVWGGFRVADRARITKTEESSNGLFLYLMMGIENQA